MQKQQSKKYLLLILLIAVLVVIFAGEIIAHNYFEKKSKPQISAAQLDKSLENATLSYPNPYNESVNDKITLSNGHALISDEGDAEPRVYDVAATAIGNLNGDGVPEGAIALYQGWGANIIEPVVFVFAEKNGALTQVDSAKINSFDAKINSLSIDNNVLSLNLLVVPEKDQQSLPHYEWKPTESQTINYKLVNGKLVTQ
jgi:hypothetical protein